MAGDYYVFSLAPGSPSLGALAAGPAHLLRPTATGPVTVVLPGTIGLLAADDVDALLCHNLDTDGDLVPNFVDNCPIVANPTQTIPAGDLDCDGVPNGTDNCPNWFNPTQALPSWPIPAGDSECDGFPDAGDAGGKARETYIGTDPLKHCAATAAANDEGTPDANPPDFNDDRIFNGQDTGKFGGPFGSFNHTVAQGPFGPAGNQLPGERFDFNGNGIISGQDTGKYQSYFNKTCA